MYAEYRNFLKEIEFRPHKVQYWLNQKHSQTRAEVISQVCDLYSQAPTLERNGERVLSTDEKTGIQALEHKHPLKPTRSGLIARCEHEYIRHGTQCVIANINVATGKIVSPSVFDTRTEADFLAHIKQTVSSEVGVVRWHFILDQLNTHQSESLVRFVAEQDNLELDLGVKGKSGILKSKNSRAEFLGDSSHSVVFHYTPKHSSWMNQIEGWFSILVRKLLKRSSFKSKEDLKTQILEFITYFNATMAKAFKWAFQGFGTQKGLSH